MRPRDGDRTPAGRLTQALILQSLLRRKVDVGVNAEAIAAQAKRATAELRKTPEGRDMVEIHRAMAGAETLLRAAELANLESRDTAILATRNFVQWVAEHDVTSPSALSRLMSAARWAAVEAMTFMTTLGDGTDANRADSVKQLDRASTRAAYDLSAALESIARAGRPSPSCYRSRTTTPAAPRRR